MLKRVQERKPVKRSLTEKGDSVLKTGLPQRIDLSSPLGDLRMLQRTVGNRATQNALRQFLCGDRHARVEALEMGQTLVTRNAVQAGLVQLQEIEGTTGAKPFNIGKAVAANRKRLQDRSSVIALQGVLNMGSRSGTFDRRTVELIDAFQTANKVFVALEGERGVVTEETLKAVFDKLLDKNQYNQLIFIMIDYYLRATYQSIKHNIVKLEYDKDLLVDGEFTTRRNENEFEITIGKTAFRNFEYLVHTIGHEFEHAGQKKERMHRARRRKPFLPAIGVDEFRAEAFNILTERLPMKRFDDFMDDAERAFDEWQHIDWVKVPGADANALVFLYKRVRKRVIKVFGLFKSSPLAAKHRNIKERYENLEPKIIRVR